MDRIFITDLRIETIIGIDPPERITPQTVVLNLEMSADIARAAASEDIAHTLNYKTLADTLEAYIKQSQFLLLETMAEKVTELIRRDFSVAWVRLDLHKPDALAGSTDVGIIIERGDKPA